MMVVALKTSIKPIFHPSRLH